MKHLFTTLVFAASIALSAQSESAPAAQQNQNQQRNENPSTLALWDLEFSHNITTLANSVGCAGICYLNNEFWISKWASDTIIRFDAAGTYLNKFIVAGLSGVRAFTTDGTYIYASTNSNTIFRIDPATATLAPPHTTVSVVLVRWATYDATLNANAGGFWVGNFNTDIYSVDMSGNQLSAIPAATHGLTGMYGGAVDNYTAGGPYLWVSHQGGPNTTQINGLSIATGTSLATHDVFPDIATTHSLTSSLAGGAFLTNQYISGEVTLMTCVQGTPNNVFAGYEVQQPFPPAPTNDFEIVRTYPEQGYTQIPQLHTFAERFVIEYVNNSNAALDTVNIQFSISNTGGPQYTETIQLLNIASGASGTAFTQTYWPTAIDAYTALADGQTSPTSQDSVPGNNTASFTYYVTDSIFSRDDSIPEISGQSISPTSWGYYGANYELRAQDTVGGIWIRLTFPVAGDTTYAVIVNTSGGIPTTVHTAGPPVIIDTMNWYYLPFTNAVALNTGTYTFGCYEEVDGLLSLSVSSIQYTAAANYVYAPAAGWFQPGTPHAYFIHPAFRSSMMSAGENAQPDISVFPNPAADEVNVYVGNDELKTFTITDVNGKVVKTLTSAARQVAIDISEFAAGTYTLQVATEGNSWSQQVIKQ